MLNGGGEPCDYAVVFAGQCGMIREKIAKHKTLFIAGEPPAIKKYSEDYLAQFGSVICSDVELSHSDKHMYQQGYPWFCGLKFLDGGKKIAVKTYDDFASDADVKKTRLLSVVCSDKQSKPGHKKRFEFVARLKEVFGDDLDLYGTGQNPVDDKSDAIRPYQYHIAIENSSTQHYWTEKLSDCYLEQAYPFYAGCPNLEEYFSTDAYTTIDIDDPEGAVNLIRRAIEEDRYGSAQKALAKARKDVLEKYNLFNLIVEHFEKLEEQSETVSEHFRAFPAKWFRKGPFYKLKLLLSDCLGKNRG